MTEAVAVSFDPSSDAGEPSSSPDQDSSSELAFELDKAPGEPSDDTDGQSNEQTAVAQAEGDTPADTLESNATPEEDRDGRLRHDDYTRKTTALAQEREAFAQEKLEYAQAQTEALRQQAQQGPAESQHVTRSQQIRQQLSATPDYSEATPHGISAAERRGMEEIADMLEGAAQTVYALNDLQSRFDALEASTQQTGQAVSSITEAENSVRAEKMLKQLRDAKELYGDSAVTDNIEAIRRNINAVNPDTGQPLTVAEIVGRWTGKSVEGARAALEANRQGVRDAKAGAALPGASVGTGDTNAGKLTQAQAVAMIASTPGYK